MQLIYKRSLWYYDCGHSFNAELKELHFEADSSKWFGSINLIDTDYYEQDVETLSTGGGGLKEYSIKEGKPFGNAVICLDSDFEKMLAL